MFAVVKTERKPGAEIRNVSVPKIGKKEVLEELKLEFRRLVQQTFFARNINGHLPAPDLGELMDRLKGTGLKAFGNLRALDTLLARGIVAARKKLIELCAREEERQAYLALKALLPPSKPEPPSFWKRILIFIRKLFSYLLKIITKRFSSELQPTQKQKAEFSKESGSSELKRLILEAERVRFAIGKIRTKIGAGNSSSSKFSPFFIPIRQIQELWDPLSESFFGDKETFSERVLATVQTDDLLSGKPGKILSRTKELFETAQKAASWDVLKKQPLSEYASKLASCVCPLYSRAGRNSLRVLFVPPKICNALEVPEDFEKLPIEGSREIIAIVIEGGIPRGWELEGECYEGQKDQNQKS